MKQGTGFQQTRKIITRPTIKYFVKVNCIINKLGLNWGDRNGISNIFI